MAVLEHFACAEFGSPTTSILFPRLAFVGLRLIRLETGFGCPIERAADSPPVTLRPQRNASGSRLGGKSTMLFNCVIAQPPAGVDAEDNVEPVLILLGRPAALSIPEVWPA